MTKCVIIDDEPLAIEIIETYLSQIKGTALVAKFTDSVEAFTFLQQHSIDLVFLDLNMPMFSGMELLKSLKQRPDIIVTTAYRDYAVESFEFDVLDYLVKPFSFARFLKAVNKCMSQKAGAQYESARAEQRTEGNGALWLRVDKKLVAISPQDILYVESLKDYVRVITSSQKFIIYHTLQAMLDKLPAREFVRIHKSYVIQIAKIDSIEGNLVHVKDSKLPIGRNFRKELFERVEG